MMESTNKRTYFNVFQTLGSRPTTILPEQVQVLESYLLEVYYPNSEASSLDSERERPYVRLENSNIRQLPVSVRGLTEHIKHACFQAGWLWQEAVNNSTVQNPEEWGWILKDGRFVPNWQSNMVISST